MGFTGYGQGPHTYMPAFPGGWRTVAPPPGHWQSLCTMPKAAQKNDWSLQNAWNTAPGYPSSSPKAPRKEQTVHGCAQLQVSLEGGPRTLRGGNLHHSHVGHTHAFNSLKSSVTGRQPTRTREILLAGASYLLWAQYSSSKVKVEPASGSLSEVLLGFLRLW